MNIFTQFFKNNTKNENITKDLIKLESELASDIFGPVPETTKREFFCLDKNTWIWFEDWIDDAGDRHQMTTRYMVRPTEIVKSQNGGAYHRLTVKEVKNFRNATSEYVRRAKKELYDKHREAAVHV